MTDQNEKSDLEQLLSSAGWLRVLERARVDWRDGYPAKIKQAIFDAKANRENIESAVASIEAASDAINQLLSWPKERLAQLERGKDVTQTTFTRGGYDTSTAR